MPNRKSVNVGAGRLQFRASTARRTQYKPRHPEQRQITAMQAAVRSPMAATVKSLRTERRPDIATMADIHDRIPVILEPDDWAAWLGRLRAILRRC